MDFSQKPPPNKWMLILKVSLFNSIATLLIIFSYGMFVGFDVLIAELATYEKIYSNYIGSSVSLMTFINITCYTVGGEEVQYRLLPWLFMIFAHHLYKKCKIDEDKIGLYILIWLPFLVSNYYWTTIHHINFNAPLVGIFVAGLTWSWLIIKTRDWTSSVIAHFMANTTIFLFVRILIYFGYKP